MYTQRVQLTLVGEGPLPLAVQIESALRSNTSLVVVCHQSNVTGQVQPIEEIAGLCKRRKIPLLIDAAQSVGHIPLNLDALGCMVAMPGHKGLLGPQGTGALYLGTQLPFTLKEGGTGSQSFSLLQPQEVPELYEAGTLNIHGIAGLLAGTQFVAAHASGINQNIALRCTQLRAYLQAQKNIMCYGGGEGIVSFTVGDIPSGEIADALDFEFGIATRAGAHCAPLMHRLLGTQEQGVVRLSPGAFTTQADVDAFATAVDAILLTYG